MVPSKYPLLLGISSWRFIAHSARSFIGNHGQTQKSLSMVLTGNNSTTMSCISIDFHTEYSYVLPKLLKVGPVLITILVRVYVAMMKRLKKTDLKQLLKHSRPGGRR